ncbi:MAG: PAS domain S-box protein [Pirellulaceae bacterium]
MFSSDPPAIPDDSGELFQSLLALLPAGVYLTDVNGNCIYVNARWCEMAGIEPGEALGRGWMRGIHVDDREVVTERWYEVAKSGGEWRHEYRMQTPHGQTTWVLGLGKALSDDQGQISGYLGINVDITERKAAESKLQASERHYAKQLSAVTSYRYSVAFRNGVPVSTEHSPGCLAVTGYTPEDYSSHPCLWIEMVHPEDRELVRQHAATVMRNDAVPHLEHRILHKSGAVRWIRHMIVRHYDENGSLVRYDGLVENISEPGQVEETLRSVLESAPDAMVLVNREGRILFANAQTERVFGFRREELLHQPVEILLPDCLRNRHVAERATYSRAPSVRMMSERSDLLGRRKDGFEFAAEIALSPVQTADGHLTVAAIRDVTQRKNMEETLRSNLETQSALASLLRLSLEPLSVEELLGRALDLLLLLPWLRLEAKGAIFLVKEDDPQVLVVKTQRGLTEPLLTEYYRVPIGRCLCGEAVNHRQVVFASGVDEHHVNRYSDMTPHGYYCIPIISDDTLFGVINLYVEHGHERKAAEEIFLMAVANVLAGIVERKRAEEALSKSEERFDLAVQGTDAGIWDWDLLTNQVYYSPRWKSMLGYEDHEIGTHFSEWEQRLHPDEQASALTCIQDYLAGRTPKYELEHRLRHKDGLYRWILARGAVVRDGSGKPYRMVGSHVDITDRKRSEQLMREREAELIAAQRIQEYILPHSAPCVPGYDIAGSLLPAEFAAGDYFDYLPMPDGSLGIVVGDVCGHGFSAALIMASLSAHLRSFMLDHSDIGEILRHVNTLLWHETDGNRFVTLVFVQIELASRSLKHVNLGHPSGYVLGPSGDVKGVLKSGAFPLAVMPDMDIPLSEHNGLEPHDIVLLLTDGILEARSPEGALFGDDRMLEVVRANRDRRASEIIQSLQQAVFDFTGLTKPQDDLTAVVIKVETIST